MYRIEGRCEQFNCANPFRATWGKKRKMKPPLFWFTLLPFGSGPNDHVFVYFTDHGAPGILAFPDDDVSTFWTSCPILCLSMTRPWLDDPVLSHGPHYWPRLFFSLLNLEFCHKKWDFSWAKANLCSATRDSFFGGCVMRRLSECCSRPCQISWLFAYLHSKHINIVWNSNLDISWSYRLFFGEVHVFFSPQLHVDDLMSAITYMRENKMYQKVPVISLQNTS